MYKWKESKMFKSGGIPLLLIGKPEFRLLVEQPVYFIFERAYRKAGSCSAESFGE